MHWLIRHVMRALYPATDELPGIEDTGLDEFLRAYRRDTPTLMWLGLSAGCLLFTLLPFMTVYVPLPSFLLPRSLLDRHAHRISASSIYLVRQAVVLVKLPAGLCWGSHPSVRAKMSLPPYPEDPGTVRGSSEARPPAAERAAESPA